MKAEVPTSRGALRYRPGGARLRGKGSLPRGLCLPGSASFVLAEAFQMPRVCAQVFRGAGDAADEPSGLSQRVSGTGAAFLTEVILQGDPYEVRWSLSFHPGALANTSSKGRRNTDRDALRGHVRHYTTSVRHMAQLDLPQADRPISGVNDQQISAAIQLAANFAFANLAFGRNWHVQVDVAVSGVQIDVGGQIFRHFERHRAIAAFEPPACRQR